MIKNVFYDVDGAQFFNLYVPYMYSRDVAVETLAFCISCTIAFIIGYILSKCVLDNRSLRPARQPISEKYINKAICILNVFLALQIGLGLYAISRSGLNYSAIFNLKMSMSFLYESRMLPLVLLGFVYLNKSPETWLKEKRMRLTAILLALYFVVSVIMQSRSVIFECAAVIGVSWLMWQGNKIRIKYIFVVLCSMIVPNLIVLPRLSNHLHWREIVNGIFSFEYTVLINNIVSSAIASDHPPLLIDFFIGIPSLIIPSPLRCILGTGIASGVAPDYVMFILEDANAYGGGFSLFAEMYMNLGWWGILMFVFLAFFIGKFIKGAARVGKVNLVYATTPLIYAQFIIALRNNFSIFAKYAIQSIVVAIMMTIILKIKWIPVARTAQEQHTLESIKITT